MILRDVKVDEAGEIIREADPMALDDLSAPMEQEEGETVEMEGAFVVRDGRALFVPIEIGIAGERHSEVLDGVAEGDEIVIGPFDVIRTLVDNERVTVQDAERAEGTSAANE